MDNLKSNLGPNQHITFSSTERIDTFLKFSVTVENEFFRGTSIFMTEIDEILLLIKYCKNDHAVDEEVILHKSKYEQNSYISLKKIDELGHYKLEAYITGNADSEHAKIIITTDRYSLEEFSAKLESVILN